MATCASILISAFVLLWKVSFHECADYDDVTFSTWDMSYTEVFRHPCNSTAKEPCDNVCEEHGLIFNHCSGNRFCSCKRKNFPTTTTTAAPTREPAAPARESAAPTRKPLRGKAGFHLPFLSWCLGRRSHSCETKCIDKGYTTGKCILALLCYCS
ncbi:uncharacterized protein [Periplaneta americana]|uniref:uncharacterized protein n=1 Tax=Periplaneta americana TaxID=6978 RepID=UPI0037E8ACDD